MTVTTIKPTLPRGMRDFPPAIMRKRRYILDTLEETFRIYGFQQLETPAMEQREVLTGKYGDEGDKLIFNVLRSGDYLKDVSPEDLRAAKLQQLTPHISDKALRYDLTVPLARFVALHRHELALPFRRYQVQPVWRADKPQKGRYREFCQCDADIIGSNALLNEVDLINLFRDGLTSLRIKDFTVLLNHRRILAGLAEKIGAANHFPAITVAIDKLDKAGFPKVKKELERAGLSAGQISEVEAYLQITGNSQERLDKLRTFFSDQAAAKAGMDDVRAILDRLGKTSSVAFDQTLARGLDYYTGAIFEVKPPPEVQIGSIGGGGRYDDLCGTFGLEGVSGTGISFGVDRIYEVMEAQSLFPDSTTTGTQLLFVNFDKEAEKYCLPLLQQAREAGIAAELYPDQKKMGKQFKYAEKQGIPYVVVAGPEERQSGKPGLKDMASGKQEAMAFEDIIEKLRHA